MKLSQEQWYFVTFLIFPALSLILIPIIKSLLKNKINKIDRWVYAHIKHKVARDTILKAILAAQKDLRTESGKKRFEYAKNIILFELPWLKRYHIDALIQEIYNEFINADLADNK